MSYPKIVQVTPMKNMTLLISFDNGIQKEYDCRQLLSHEVFTPLQHERFFNTAVVGSGGYGVVWNDDVDIAESELWINGKELIAG